MKWTSLVWVGVALASPALGQSRAERQRQRQLERIAREFEVSVETLDAVHAERLGARDPAERLALIAEIGQRAVGELTPVVVQLALRDPEIDCRVAATRALSVVGLEADREDYLETILPALERLRRDRAERVWVEALDTDVILARWFRADHAVARTWERAFHSDNLRQAQKALQGLLDVAHPQLRERLVLACMADALGPRSRFGAYDRKRVVAAIPEFGGPWGTGELAQALHDDGTIAVECAQVLGELGDSANALPALRRVGTTASHALRVPVLIARGKLGDPSLPGELPGVLSDDHPRIQVALVTALGHHPEPRLDRVLERLAETAEGDLRRAVALARLRRGDEGEEAWLRERVTGPGASGAVAREVLAIDNALADRLVLLIAGNEHLGGLRRRAVERLGDRGLDTPHARRLLRGLCDEDPSPLRLHAALSLAQLGDDGAAARVEAAMEDVELVGREDVDLIGGTGRRFTGGLLWSVLRRLQARPAPTLIPLLAGWFAPVDQEEASDEGGTQTREEGDPEPVGGPAWWRQPFVRAEAASALGALAEGAEGELRERALEGLAAALEDPSGVVWSAATRAVERAGGPEAAPQGSEVDDEQEARAAARGWLAGR